MDSWLTGCEQTTSLDFTSAALDETVVHINARLERHAKQLEQQAREIKEMDELVLVCSREVTRAEGEADYTTNTLERFERQMEERASKQDAKIDKLAKIVSHLPSLEP